MDNKGKHSVADIYFSVAVSDSEIKAACVAAIEKSGLKIVDELHYHFEPFGLTSVWVLSESHFTLHTYPEHNYVSVDCYTCGTEGMPEDAVTHLLKVLPVESATIKNIQRG